jgi:hypothetical protein
MAAGTPMPKPTPSAILSLRNRPEDCTWGVVVALDKTVVVDETAKVVVAVAKMMDVSNIVDVIVVLELITDGEIEVGDPLGFPVKFPLIKTTRTAA